MSFPMEINLAKGQPREDLLPMELVKEATVAAMTKTSNTDVDDPPGSFWLNYGDDTHGEMAFRRPLAQWLTKHLHMDVDPANLFVTAGVSQGIEMVVTHLSRPGDTIIVENPTYFLAKEIFKTHGLNIVAVPVDSDGINAVELEKAIKAHSPKLLYIMPIHHNPTGVTLTHERRKKVAALVEQYRVTVIADECYQLLGFANTVVPGRCEGVVLPLCTYSENVISLSTFSKIFAPGIRVGWMQASRGMLARFTSSGFLQSGGSIPHFACGVLLQLIRDGRLDIWLAVLREEYSRRASALCEELCLQLPSCAHFTPPVGGYFVWVQLPEHIDGTKLMEASAATKAGVVFKGGGIHSATDNSHKNYVRLCFARHNAEELREGARRFAAVVSAAITKPNP